MDRDYKIIFSELSKENLSEILTYISVNLHSPSAAENVLNCLQKEILSLTYFPNRNPLAKEKLFQSLDVRKVTVQNYSIYYHVDESEMSVLILSVIYARRDQKNAIAETLNQLN